MSPKVYTITIKCLSDPFILETKKSLFCSLKSLEMDEIWPSIDEKQVLFKFFYLILNICEQIP